MIVDDHSMPYMASAPGSLKTPPVPAPRSNRSMTPSAAPRPSSAVATLPQSLTARELEPNGPPDKTYKVVFAGDAAVGKTSFINRITKGVFIQDVSSTLGVDFQIKVIGIQPWNWNKLCT